MAVFVGGCDFGETLKTTPSQGKRLIEPFKTFSNANRLPMHVLEDVSVENEPEIHRHEGDLWHCIEGEATFISGGKAIVPRIHTKSDGTKNENELKADGIDGGEEYTLHPGDWLWIPAGEPHLHKAEATARLIIIKIPQSIVPLEAIPGWE